MASAAPRGQWRHVDFPSLTLLDPSAAWTAAAIAGPLLLILYFLKLRRRPVRVSSTLLWSQAIQDLQVNAPFRWIRPTWLLLLQLLGLACLIAAVGRPAIDSTGGSGRRTLIVVDHSASMSARDADDEGRSRLQLAKDRAKEVVDRATARGDARVMIVGFADDATSLTGLTRDRSLLKKAIEAIEPTDQPARMESALKLIEAIAARENTEADAGPMRVVLVSDSGGSLSGEAGAGLEGASLEYLRVGPEPAAPRDNLGIVSLAVRRDYDDPTRVRVFVRVSSTLSKTTDVGIRCTYDGQTVDTAVLKLDAATPAGPSVGVRTLTFTSAAGGTCVVSLLRDDALAADNTAAAVLAASSALRIGLVRRGSPDVAGLALEQALASLEPFELRGLTPDSFAPASGARIDDLDLLVFDRVAPQSMPRTASLSFGGVLPISGIAAVTASEDDSVAFWERTHPVMRFVSLGNVRLRAGTRVQLEESALAGTGARVMTLASGLHGPLISLIEQGLTRRIVVGFTLADTNWWRSDSFPIFVANAVDYLTGRGEEGGGVQFTTTQALRLAAPAATSVELIGAERFARTAVADADGVAVFGVVPRVGVYSARVAGRALTNAAVNLLSAEESAISTSADLSIGGRAISGSTRGQGPREVWAWFAAAGLALLTVEWLVFAWRMRV